MFLNSDVIYFILFFTSWSQVGALINISKLTSLISISLYSIELPGIALHYILLHCIAFSAGFRIRLRSKTGCSNMTHQISLQ